MFLIYLFLTIPVRPILSKSTGPIFVKFPRLALIEMIDLKLVFRSLERSCHGNQFMLSLDAGI